MPFGWSLPLPGEAYWPTSLLWLLPVCEHHCPGSLGKPFKLGNTTIDEEDDYPTDILGRIHAWAHYERSERSSWIEIYISFMHNITLQLDAWTSTPRVRRYEDLAAAVGHSENWKDWKERRTSRDLDVGYLRAWQQDARSELVALRLAAQLRWSAMVEARERLRPRCVAFSEMLRAMIAQDTQDLVQFAQTSSARLKTIESELAAIKAKLAANRARFTGEKLQWDTKQDKLCEDEDGNDKDKDKGEEDMMQAELEAMKEEYCATRDRLQDEKKKLEIEAVALCREMRRVMPELRGGRFAGL